MSHPPPHFAHPQQGQQQYAYPPQQQQYAPQHYPPAGYGPPPPHAQSSHGRFAPPPQPQYQPQPPPAAVPAQPQPQPQQAPGVPYIGARISLISNMNIRYEGILYTIDTKAATVALQHVRCFGTEDRPGEFVPASPDVYEFIVYSGRDIKDLSVLQAQPPSAMPPQDPAILSAQAPPPPAPFNQPPEVEIQPEQPEPQQQQQQPQPSHPRQQRGGRPQPPQQQGARHTVRMINEQPQQPQQAAPAAAAAAPIEQGEFDMQSSNARFAKVTVADSKQDESASSSSSVPSYELPSADGGLDTSGFPVVQKKYDPKKSFFDELTTDRGAAAPGAGREMRRIDTDTFGADAQGFRARHGRNGGGGGGGQGGQRRARGRGNQAAGGQQQQPQQGQWRNEAQN